MGDEWRIDDVRRWGSMSHALVFIEDVPQFREDLAAEAVEFLATLPGVTAVERVEREAIEMAAHAVSISQLTDAVRRWWEAAKEQRRPWMIAMDRAAQTVLDLTVAAGYRYRLAPNKWPYEHLTTPPVQRHSWELTRVVDDEVSHVIALDHEFGDEPGEHSLAVAVGVRLTLPDLESCWVMGHVCELDDEVALASAVTDRVLPTLDALSSVDAMLDRWQGKRSIKDGRQWRYQLPEARLHVRLHARLLISRGRLAEARELYQQEFDRSLPTQRAYLLRFVEGLGVPPLTTATNPHLSVAQEATLAWWQANTAAMTEQLRSLTGARLDGSRRSLDELWAWLRDSQDRLQATFADATPTLADSYYGVLTDDIRSGRRPSEPWYRVTVELVTAYLGEVVIGEAPGTVWGIADDGGLAMIRHSGDCLLWQVFAITRDAFGARVDEFDPRRLRRLADDMVRLVNNKNSRPWIVRLGVPGP